MVYMHKLIFTWPPAISFYTLAFILIRAYCTFIKRPLKGGLFSSRKCFINTIFLNNNCELTYADNMHSRISGCICHFFDADNVIIEHEQIRGRNQEVDKISPWSECLTVYTPHAIQNAILNQKLQKCNWFLPWLPKDTRLLCLQPSVLE